MASAVMFILSSCSSFRPTLSTPSQADAYSTYIATYSDMAVSQMKQYGIPASITLAQGLLESNAGRSSLAIKCNNHFGIKCHNDWTGGKMYHDDDKAQECFRCYKSAQDSFRDHSLFLVGSARYSKLFQLDSRDYKGWAKGLKAAGYATSPTYADKLIELIERYGLDRYDQKNSVRLKKGQLPHSPKLVNGQRCVVLREGETLKDIAREYGMTISLVRRFNEVNRKFVPQGGTNIYLERKKSRADREHRTYIVKSDDSLWSISQQFGIRMKPLAARNQIGQDNPLTVGMTIVFR